MRTEQEALNQLVRDASTRLDEALAIVATQRGREIRERHRRLLDTALDLARQALSVNAGATMPLAASILARAHAARAKDALHGAGQLSLSAQRAPTSDACDDGWRRVEAIVTVATEAAAAARTAARGLESDTSKFARAARDAAAKADAAATAARSLLETRNDAYTFHTDYGFSFGEGWYVAAAAVLAGVAIQIEPNTPATGQATRFLRDAGLVDRLQPYRSRPRANKQTTEIVASFFRADPSAAQNKLRVAFLGDATISTAVREWIDPKLARYGDRTKVLIWVREVTHHPGRNSLGSEVVALVARAESAGMLPVLVGDALRDGVPAGAVDMTLFWKEPTFRGEDGRRAQLQFFEHLRRSHGVVGQLGVTTAGMDGPALMGMPTMYLTDSSNVRMRAWVDAVPGYREIVRRPDYLDRLSEVLDDWARR